MKKTKEKKSTLNEVQKLRYRMSAEYFSKGASEHLKNSFSNFGFAGISDFQKRLEREKSNKEQEKKQQKKKKKVKKKPVNKYMIGIKAAAFIGACVGAIAVFKKLNELFEKGKEKAKDFVENDLGIDVKEVEETVTPFIDTIKKSLSDNIINPLKDGFDKFCQQGSWSDYDNLPEGSTNEDRWEKFGIIGSIFRDITLAALRRTIKRRGYGLILNFFDIEDPTLKYQLDDTMWNFYKDNKQTYFHVGHSLTEDGIRAAKYYNEQYQKQIGEVFSEMTNFGDREIINVDTNLMEKITPNERFDSMPKLLGEDIYYKVKYRFRLKGKEKAGEKKYGVKEIDVLRLSTFGGESLVEETEKETYSEYFEKNNFSDIIHGRASRDKKAWPFIQDSNVTIPAGEKYENFRQIIKYVGEQYHYTRLPNEHKKQIDKLYDIINFKYYNRDYQWSRKKFFTLIQMFTFFSQWERYQAIKSLHSMRLMLQDFTKEQYVVEKMEDLQQFYKRQKQKVDRFIVDYSKGRLSVDEFLKKMDDSLFKKDSKTGKKKIKLRTLGTLEDDMKMGIIELQKKIPYGQLQSKIQELRKTIQENIMSGITEPSGSNVLVINNKSFRESFKNVDKNYDSNSMIEGRQFGSEYIKGTKMNVYSGDKYAKQYYNERYYMRALWWCDDLAIFGETGRFVGFEKIGNLDDSSSAGNSKSIYSTEDEAIEKSGYKPVKGYPRSIIITRTSEGGFVERKVEKELFIHVYEEHLGYKFQKRYETVDENGEIYLDDIWCYYDKDKKFLGFGDKKSQKSYKSNPAIFRNEINENELDDLYNLPTDLILRILNDAFDVTERKLEKAFMERQEIIAEMKEAIMSS